MMSSSFLIIAFCFMLQKYEKKMRWVKKSPKDGIKGFFSPYKRLLSTMYLLYYNNFASSLMCSDD